MARSVFVLGGTGQIGRAIVPLLLSTGWDVTVAARNRSSPVSDLGARFVELDRDEGIDLRGDFDAVVDVVPYTAEHAHQLLRLGAGSIVAISSASVYADDEGRTLDEAKDEETFPVLPAPIPERQRTVEPGDETYSTRKVAIERILLEQDDVPATVVRPCAIHGPGGSDLREWYFVKRVIDGRRTVVLAHRGESRFHTTSTLNLAELVRLALKRPATRILNCGDPDPPSVLEISRSIASVLEHEWAEHLVKGQPTGATPWSVPPDRPFVLDMTSAEREFGYVPVATYHDAVAETCRWLVERKPKPAEYMKRWFDYDSEDAFLAATAS